MKIAATITMALMAGAVLQARGPEQRNQRRIAVCMEGAPGEVRGHSRILASQIFAQIGVTIDWHTKFHCPPEGILISLRDTTPKDFLPGALAYALPYEGVHICVFYDRIIQQSKSHSVPRVLAHVLVHEITHILEYVGRHSSSGVMKAHWDEDDFRYMDRKCLPFDNEDVELIRSGLSARAARTLSLAEASTTAAVTRAQE
ncbi:MAG: hypothetical protein ABI833_20505 [Acidobacteriota bacterium]